MREMLWICVEALLVRLARCRRCKRRICHHPRMRVIQYAAASRLYHERLWNTGSPGQAGRWHPL